jgi:hypothetical protein
VLPLGTGITLDSPLMKDHAIDAVVHDAAVTTAGYQGTQRPTSGLVARSFRWRRHMVLRDAAGLVVDSLNYGLSSRSVGFRGLPRHFRNRRERLPRAYAGVGAGRGGGRPLCLPARPTEARALPDGLDTDSNCTDFLLQAATSLPASSAAGATNIKVPDVADFRAGQTILIDAGPNLESAVIATVGTAGATTVGTATTSAPLLSQCAGGAGFIGRSDHHH